MFIGSFELSGEAQQLPTKAVGSNGCWFATPSANKEPVYLGHSKGAVLTGGDNVEFAGRLEILPGEKTNQVYPSNLNEFWTFGKRGDVISFVVS